MGLLSKLKARAKASQTRKVIVEGREGTIEVQYSPKWLMSKPGRAAFAQFTQALSANPEGAEYREIAVDFLSQILVAWDVVDDEGAPLQPTRELLLQLPDEWLDSLARALSKDLDSIAPRKRGKR